MTGQTGHMQTLMAGIRAALHMAAFAILIAIAGCQGNTGVEDIFPKAEKPLPADIVKTMETKVMILMPNIASTSASWKQAWRNLWLG